MGKKHRSSKKVPVNIGRSDDLDDASQTNEQFGIQPLDNESSSSTEDLGSVGANLEQVNRNKICENSGRPKDDYSAKFGPGPPVKERSP